MEHLAKNCRLGQNMKNKSVQEDSDKENNDKQESFVEGSEQVQYDKSLYIVIPKINMLFQIDKTTKKRIRYVHKHQDIKQKRIIVKDTSEFWLYPHQN